MEKLLEAYERNNVILFVGAGLSSNLGLPNWDQLITQLAEELHYDPRVFKTYGDFLALAEYYRITFGRIGSLRSWMDREWHSSKIKIEDSTIHQIIAKGKFPIIYTTNYDRWLELAHDKYGIPYTKIVRVNDITVVKEGVKQIVKFHGDFDDDSSIVLDETSFFERLDFESPLDIKFRSDILGKSVLFIGYSLSDINVRLLFYRLSRLWSFDKYNAVRPASYIFNHKYNPIQEKILKRWGIKMISIDEDDPKKALTIFLEKLVGEEFPYSETK